MLTIEKIQIYQILARFIKVLHDYVTIWNHSVNLYHHNEYPIPNDIIICKT
ncbi:unnamed protein product [Callosobruchus maculatus]|uniref:Uncharacterized protein n=1 Tax=Callosobruchus maculatus TaxID=64391 RepID=A0A653C5G7_CALMS|nr:unnamed protein product [Callosobruchus maculatus]